jgi:hypothetical protein
MKLLSTCLLALVCSGVFAQAKVAIVKALRGEASVDQAGKKTALAVDTWVVSGSTITTGPRSFVRLVFIDKSQMNIGPSSEMRIEQFGGGDAGVIGMVRGKLRSQVSKDYLQQKNKDKSKLFIKTPNAVMGIRGTDFMISTNGQNTAAVLFEGEVVFNKLENGAARDIPTSALEAVVNGSGTARMQPGEFSVMQASAQQPTVPSVLNVQQLETLEKSADFSPVRNPSQDANTTSKSVVPPGLTGEVVANQNDALKAELSQVTGAQVDRVAKPDLAAAMGGETSAGLKPTNGSFLHVDSGTVIAPPADAVFDANSNSFIASSASGTVSADGNYAPPQNVTITDGGKVLVNTGGQVVEVRAPSTVMGQGPTLGDVMQVAGSAAVTAGTGRITGSEIVAAASARTSAAGINRPVAVNGPPTNIVVPKEAPTLCSSCGGIIPGSSPALNNTTRVIVNPTNGDAP